MAGRESAKYARNAKARRCGVVMGGALSAFVAAAAVATGSAAPAKADFEDLLDPIIQPLLTSFTDSISAFDPAAAVDITSWTDSLLSSIGSFDLALPSVAEPAAAAASSSVDAAALTGGTIPLTVLEGTEPAVYATIGDSTTSVPLLVDTGSAGLVVPESDLGVSNLFQLFLQDGLPNSFGSSGYSGGVDYIYLTYNNLPVDYAGGVTTDGPVDVEVYSWDPGNFGSLFTNDAFQSFLSSNDVSGILGIGDNASGPTTSPFADYGGVLINVPQHELVLSATNPLASYASTSGAPISTVLESVNGGTATSVSSNIDSGGVFGTIPSSLVSGSVPAGTVITVDNTAGQELYSYTTTNNFDVGTGTGVSDAPTVVTGTSIDSGVIPFLTHPVYLDYANDTLYFDTLST